MNTANCYPLQLYGPVELINFCFYSVSVIGVIYICYLGTRAADIYRGDYSRLSWQAVSNGKAVLALTSMLQGFEQPTKTSYSYATIWRKD